MENLTKQFQTDVKDVNENDRTITHYISTINVDSYREVLMPKGMDDSKFKAVLWSHERDTWSIIQGSSKPSQLVIGKSLWRTPDNYGVLAKTQFAETPLAEDVYQFNKQGYINSWSVGWMPKGDVVIRDDGVKQFDNWYLYEYSAVIFPANNESVNLSNENYELMFKSAQSDEVKSYFEIKTFKDSIINFSKNYIEQDQRLLEVLTEIKSFTEFKEAITNSINEIKESLEAKKNIRETVSEKRISQDELKSLVKSSVAGAVRNITGRKI